jgi:hypothetical protein
MLGTSNSYVASTLKNNSQVFFHYLHTQHPSWLYNCKFSSWHKVKRATRLSSENQAPLWGYYGGRPPPKKMVPFFHKNPRFKYAKYNSTQASGEFMRGASGQRGKTRKSEIAYASGRIRPFSLAS